MKKSKFIKSTIILLIGGIITKILGMIIKIITTRILGVEGIGLYMLITPTFGLFITLSTLGLPIAISKFVAEDRCNNKNIVLGLIPISIIINTIIIVLIFLSANFISKVLLNDTRCYLAIISIGLVLPFISISSIIRSYFFGKEKMVPHVISNIVEDLVRILIIYFGLPIFLKRGIEASVAFLVLSNIISEITSILILFLFFHKNFKIEKKDFIIKKSYLKDVFSISIPTLESRLIGNIGYFFEPIILTNTLLFVGYSNSFIIKEYGIISGYVLPILLLPSFFTMAISQALIPIISIATARKNYSYAYKKVKQAIFVSLLIGIPVTIVFLLFPEVPMKLIYNEIVGVKYTKVLALICLLSYLESPLSCTLQAMGKARDSMHSTLVGMIIRLSLLFICSLLKIGMWSLVIATSSSIIYVTLHNLSKVKKYLKKNKI